MTPIRFGMALVALATLLPPLPAAENDAVESVEATRFSSEIGTGKMEGAVADLAGNFYFCNIDTEGLDTKVRGTIDIIRPGADDAELLMLLPEGMRGNGLRIGPQGHLYLADQLGGRVVRIDLETQAHEVLFRVPSEELKWTVTPNDIAITPDGEHLYVSCVGNGVYRMGLDGSGAEKVYRGGANGIEISPDGERLILAKGIFTIRDDGSLEDTGLALQLPQEGYAYPDGMRCDAEGNIYVSRAGGRVEVDGRKVRQPGAVHVFNPDGELIRNIVAPHPKVHNVGFGGPDGKTLYLICPGGDGFVTVYHNDIAGANQQRLAAWAGE